MQFFDCLLLLPPASAGVGNLSTAFACFRQAEAKNLHPTFLRRFFSPARFFACFFACQLTIKKTSRNAKYLGIGTDPTQNPHRTLPSPKIKNCCQSHTKTPSHYFCYVLLCTYLSHSKEYESTLYGTYNCVFCYVNKTPKTGLGQNPSLSEGRGGHELQIDTQYARVGTVPASRQRSPPADHEKRWKNTRSAMVSMEFPGSPSSDGNNIKWQPSP